MIGSHDRVMVHRQVGEVDVGVVVGLGGRATVLDELLGLALGLLEVVRRGRVLLAGLLGLAGLGHLVVVASDRSSTPR